MNKLRWFIISLVGLLTILLIVFLAQKREPATSECISPNLNQVPFPIPQRKAYGTNLVEPPGVPEWWEPQLNFFQKIQLRNITRKNSAPKDILVLNNQVWIAYSDSVAKYDTTTSRFIVYQIPDNNPLGSYLIEDLYLSKSQIIWAVLFSSNGSVLAHYDSKADEFFVVSDNEGILDQTGPITWSDIPSIIGELSNGQLVFQLGWEIFSFDPENQQAKKLLGLESGLRVDTLTISRDDTIWFTSIDDFDLRSLNPLTGVIKNYGVPSSLVQDNASQAGLANSSKAIIVDMQGNVWVGYFERLESRENGEYIWHQIERPVVFVDIYDTEVYVYKWASVLSVTQLSDGDMWFSTSVGVVRYDITEDNWCWIASQPFPLIAEDDKGKIWMIYMDARLDQIYKLEQ